MTISLTPKAIQKAQEALQKRGTPDAFLRLGIKGGGCSGYAYVIEFVDSARAKDNVFDFEGVKVLIDPKSLVLLDGSVLDYETKLMEYGFKFRNPREKSVCGCGESFTIE